MFNDLIKKASYEKIVSFLSEEMEEVKSRDKEMYEELVDRLYVKIYGHHFSEINYNNAVSMLNNSDKSIGPHWSLKEILDYSKSKGMNYDDGFNEYDFAYTMNMIYSVYHKVIGDNVEMYFQLSKAFLEDKGAPHGKAFRYYIAMKE